MANRGKMRQIEDVIRSKIVVEIGVFYYRCVCLFPVFIDQENLSLPGRILQAIGPAENDRTPRSDIILFLEP